MKKDWKYILYVTVAVAIYAFVKLISPRQFDWNITYAADDKDPYGTFVLRQLLPTLDKDITISHSFKTLYELKDSLSENASIFIVASRFEPKDEDLTTLLAHVYKGGSAFISAQAFHGKLADTLRISTYDNVFSSGFVDVQDSAAVRFVNPALDTTRDFIFRKDNILNHFDELDSASISVVARNFNGDPVTVKAAWGSGYLVLNCTPLTFTNISLLRGENDGWAAASLSFLKSPRIFWTEFYHRGRMEARTPLRFVLSNESLSWAYYLTIISILLFMLFEARRKQRVIPIVKPPANTTLEFVTTIGNLYFQRGDHKNAAEKKINFLLEQIRTRYFMDTNRIDVHFLEVLAVKSGKPQHQVAELFDSIRKIQASSRLDANELIRLNQQIEAFNQS